MIEIKIIFCTMKHPLPFSKKSAAVVFAVVAIVFAAVFSKSATDQPPATSSSNASGAVSNADQTEPSVDLAAGQLNAIKIEPVDIYRFPVEKEAVGSIAYHEAEAAHNAQPGTALNSDSTTNLSTKWLVANVSESDSPLIRVGQTIAAKVSAYCGRVFTGKVSQLGGTVWDSGGNPAVDPNTHRITVRCEISDPKNELYPGMLATVVIRVREPVKSVAIPMNGVVRNGDGTMAAWVTNDRHHFVQRIIQVGLQKDGRYQVLKGLQRGELAVIDGAVFISNILYAPPTD